MSSYLIGPDAFPANAVADVWHLDGEATANVFSDFHVPPARVTR